MHIAPTGGSGGTGVSEAKLTPNTNQARPAVGPVGAAPAISPQQAILADTAVIRELAVSDLLKLTQILQPQSPPEVIVRVDNLVHEIIRAIGDDRREWAVGRFVEAATTDPARTDELISKPELAAIRTNVEHLLGRLTNVAKMDAETKLFTVEQLLESAGWQKLPHWETSSQALIQIAHRLLEAGGYANYVRTSELATTLQSAYWAGFAIDPQVAVNADYLKNDVNAVRPKGGGTVAMAAAYHAWGALRENVRPRLQALWRRAPLLALLGAWFTAGLVGGIFSVLVKTIWPGSWFVATSNFAFRIWGLGFLALIGFGFWARVRQPRR